MTGLCASNQEIDTRLRDRIIEHEGMKQFVYDDSLGFATIGIGRCVDSRKGRGLTTDECFYLLSNDILFASKQLDPYPWYQNQDTVRKGALIELVFNLGLKGVLGFKKMIAALEAKNYMLAAVELKDSVWYTQVGLTRSKDIMDRIRYGQYTKR